MSAYKPTGCITERDSFLLEVYIAKCIASGAYKPNEILVMKELFYNMTEKRYNNNIAIDKERGLRK